MHTDNSRHLIEAAHRRRRDTAARAEAALAAVETAGQRISVTALAKKAGISRAWLYAQPQLRTRMQALAPILTDTVLPSEQRASTASQQNRLSIALTRNKQLTQENSELRAELEIALGQIRAHRLS